MVISSFLATLAVCGFWINMLLRNFWINLSIKFCGMHFWKNFLQLTNFRMKIQKVRRLKHRFYNVCTKPNFYSCSHADNTYEISVYRTKCIFSGYTLPSTIESKPFISVSVGNFMIFFCLNLCTQEKIAHVLVYSNKNIILTFLVINLFEIFWATFESIILMITKINIKECWS